MNKPKKILSIFGTRPEAIKFAPIILELQKRGIEQSVCITAQHRQMLDQVLRLFAIKTDYDLDIMTEDQTLEHIHQSVLSKLQPILQHEEPRLVLVQGDTTTAFVAALASYYSMIPVGHIEAGLRTNNKYSPFPEEINRRLISQIADWHFAPTEDAKKNLHHEGIASKTIFVTGNTVIDSLLSVAKQKNRFIDQRINQINFSKYKVVLVTVHRRENLGLGMDHIFSAIARLANDFPNLQFLFPVHLNPQIQKQARQYLSHLSNVCLIEPMNYSDLVNVMTKSYLILTDSGGIQEEAPSLGKPVVVLRDTTERQEGVNAGTAVLIGTDEQKLYKIVAELVTNATSYQTMAHAINPYGDGHAAKKIVDIIEKYAKSV